MGRGAPTPIWTWTSWDLCRTDEKFLSWVGWLSMELVKLVVLQLLNLYNKSQCLKYGLILLSILFKSFCGWGQSPIPTGAAHNAPKCFNQTKWDVDACFDDVMSTLPPWWLYQWCQQPWWLYKWCHKTQNRTP